MNTETQTEPNYITVSLIPDLPEMLKPYEKCIAFPFLDILGINNTYIIYEMEGNVFHIELITTEPEHRGKGETKFVMEHICQTADNTNTTITLIPCNQFSQTGMGLFETPSQRVRNSFYKIAAKRKGRLSITKLIKWYERLGFVKQDGTDKMIRLPKV